MTLASSFHTCIFSLFTWRQRSMEVLQLKTIWRISQKVHINQRLSLDNWLWKVWAACSGEEEYLTYIAFEFREWIFVARDRRLIRNVINDPHISERGERSPIKWVVGLYRGLHSEDFLALIGPSLLWLPSIAVTLLGTLRFVHVITLEVLRSKCVTEKLHWPKNTLACVFPIVSHLGCGVSRCISPCSQRLKFICWNHQGEDCYHLLVPRWHERTPWPLQLGV